MADTLDVITLTAAKAAVGGLTRDETLLATYITAVSRRLDDLCGPIVRRTITNELHDGGYESIWLYHAPVYAVSTVTEAQGTTQVTCTAQTFATAPAAGYVAEPHAPGSTLYSGRLRRTAGGCPSKWYPGPNTVQVSYTAGRYADTDAVDELFAEAAILCLKNLWRGEQSGVAASSADYQGPQSLFPGRAVPNSVLDLLVDEIRPPGLA